MQHPGVDLACTHRVGLVGVGEISVRVVARAPHRAEALAALAGFVDALKTDVPIWKWGVRPDGSRFPSAGR